MVKDQDERFRAETLREPALKQALQVIVDGRLIIYLYRTLAASGL
jgi:hypothetical protein